MAKLLRLDVAQLTDVGRKREHNEDNMAYVIPKDPMAMMHKGALFIVADGMGGHAAGEVASEIAVDTVSNAYYQDDNDDVPTTLLNSIRRANAAIHQRAAENMLRSGMGTTCVATVLRGNVAYVANVGDSRAYLIRNARMRQVSQDHSWVAEQVRAGLLTEEQARTHAQRNVITRSLGTQTDVEIDIFREVLEEGDTLVLCSDGLSGFISEEDLQRTVEQFVPQESVYHLVERANENGGGDNITAIVIRVLELGVEPPGVRQPVPIGGPELSNEDTARLYAPGNTGASMAATRNGEIPVSGSPFLYSSGPLVSSESVTAPQPALRSKKQHGRLFYPTLVLLILFLLAALGSGTYYFIHIRQSQTIAQMLNQASQLINQAQSQVAGNPAQALQNLARAQQQMRSLQGMSLNGSDVARLASLQSQLVSETKAAITSYNTAAKISSVPCAGTVPSSITSGPAKTQVQAMALIENNSALLYYALGQNGQIYQLASSSNQYSLTNPLMQTSRMVISFVGASSKLLALSAQLTNNAPSGYEIDLLTPSAQGTLSVTKSQSIDASHLQNGVTPTLITAWGNNVYVILAARASSNNITILNYSVDSKNNFTSSQQPFQVSVTANTSVVGTTATSKQFFLLLSDGQVLSLPIQSGQLLSAALPTSVLIDAPLQAPLSAETSNFTTASTVPTASLTQQKGNGPLTVPMPLNDLATISAGQIQNDTNQYHLYIGDPTDHRVLDLIVQPPASSGGPAGATPTPTSNASNNSVTLDLVQQYVSLSSFSAIKSVAVNPNGNNINILAQSSSGGENLLTVNAGTQQACAA